MKFKVSKGSKIFIICALIVIFAILLVTKVFSNNSNNYILDVVKEIAVSEDDNLKITEEIVKDSGQALFDTKKLNYRVKVKNKNSLIRNEAISIVIDTTTSMGVNDSQNIAKENVNHLAFNLYHTMDGSGSSYNINVYSSDGNGGSYNPTSGGPGMISWFPTTLLPDSSRGLERARDFLNTDSYNNRNKTLIYYTDSTTKDIDKLNEIKNEIPDVNIIIVLVDLTSSTYMDLNDATPTIGNVFVIPSNVDESDILPPGVKIYDEEKIKDIIYNRITNLTLNNTFSEPIADYFDIENITLSPESWGEVNFIKENGKITGYTANIPSLDLEREVTLNFNISLKSDAKLNEILDTKYLFDEICTNKEQSITYSQASKNNLQTLDGTDARIGTESTVIKISQGYSLKIKAVNESNTDLPVEGLKVKIIGENEEGLEVCNLEKTTDKKGYVNLTVDDTEALRRDGKVKFTVSATNTDSLVGYELTDSIVFTVDNNKTKKRLIYDDMQSDIKGSIDEDTRIVEVEYKINSTKLDFEINAEELNNSNITLSNCEFKLIQPKLNSKFEMTALWGTTDENGVLHFYPTVMTKDGTYEYILEQISAPDAYIPTVLTKIIVEFEKGRVVVKDETTNIIETKYNNAVTATLDENSKGAKTDHIVVKVGDECLKTNPFDLQINLVDIDDKNVKLNGAVYKITTINSTGFTRSEIAITDENGQINTKLYGSGYLSIYIEEQTPRVGYNEDLAKKEIIVQHVDEKVALLSVKPTEILNTDALRTGYLLDEEGNQKGIQINLASKKKALQNVVKLKLVDSQDTNISAGSEIVYELLDEKGDSYGLAGSDINGELSFTVNYETQGAHTYRLIPELMSVPSEYDTSKIDNEVEIELTFDENGIITSESKLVSESSSVLNEKFEVVNVEDRIENTFELEIAYYLKANSSIKFILSLLDEENKTTPINGAKYNIDIEYLTNKNGVEVTRTKKLVNRATNDEGKISTFIPKSENIRITIQEVSAKTGYTLDSTVQEIEASCLENGLIVINGQTPYDLGATSSNPDKGATVNSSANEIIYHDYNRARNSSDTYVNLTLTKQDIYGAYVDGVILQTKSADLLDGEGNALNTIIATGSQSALGKNVTGAIVYDYEDYKNNEPDSFTIRVPKVELNEEAVYEMEVSELDGITNEVKSNSTVKFRLIFRNKDGDVKLTNVETIYGNRLVKHKEFSSASDSAKGSEMQNNLGIFLSNIGIDLFTQYEDVGNLQLDLKKFNDDGEELSGAEYDVKVQNPDNTVVRKHITVKNGDESDSIEFQGLTVSQRKHNIHNRSASSNRI